MENRLYYRNEKRIRPEYFYRYYDVFGPRLPVRLIQWYMDFLSFDYDRRYGEVRMDRVLHRWSPRPPGARIHCFTIELGAAL